MIPDLKQVHTSISSNSPGSTSFAPASPSVGTPVDPRSRLVRSMRRGSLTTFLSTGIAVVSAVGLVGRIQLSNILENLFCDIELRQSVGALNPEVGVRRSGSEPESAFCFAVPPDSPLSSSSSISARRLIVSSEGSVEVVETDRDFDRRYHSSGTQNLNVCATDDAEGGKGLRSEEHSMRLDSVLAEDNRDDSDNIYKLSK